MSWKTLWDNRLPIIDFDSLASNFDSIYFVEWIFSTVNIGNYLHQCGLVNLTHGNKQTWYFNQNAYLSRKCIWKCYLQNVDHFIQPSICLALCRWYSAIWQDTLDVINGMYSRVLLQTGIAMYNLSRGSLRSTLLGWYEQNVITYKEGILPKGPYLPCVSMAGRAMLAGYYW